MSAFHLMIVLGAAGALILLFGIARHAAELRSRHDAESGGGPGEVDAARYLSRGHIAWNSAPARGANRRGAARR